MDRFFYRTKFSLVLIGADDIDGDGINDMFDSALMVYLVGFSNTNLDFDLDGCRDIDEDPDDDNDGVIDSVDFVQKVYGLEFKF